MAKRRLPTLLVIILASVGLTGVAEPLKVVLTFDDGLKDQFDHAVPLLEKYGYPATFNVVTDRVGERPKYMSWDELRALYRRGHEIVTHTCTHPSLPKLLSEGKNEKFRHEVVDSAKKLEEMIGCRVTHVCAPGNNVNKTVVDRLKQLGFELQEVRRPNLGGDFRAEKVNDYLDAQIRFGHSRCALMMHAIVGNGYCPFPGGKADLEAVLEVLRRREEKGDIQVVSYDEAYPTPGRNVTRELSLGTPFTCGAVLQRGRAVPVWGKAPSEAEVSVSFADQMKTTRADACGVWRIDLDPLEACSSGRILTVTSSGSQLRVRDVLVGEVWFASGQSNMDCPLWHGGHSRYRDGKGAMMTALTRMPVVRYVKNPHVWSVEPLPLASRWHRLTTENLSLHQISAVAFYFARELHVALGVPIGIIDSSWGGTNIDAWTPRRGYDDCDASLKEVAAYPVRADWRKETDAQGPIGGAHQQPTVLFNGMVAVWTPMAMRGFIWYQGCHNASEPDLYCAKMHALYNGWSRAFENPNLHLCFAQLAPYSQNWCGIVAAQNRFADEQPNAAVAVTSDIGNFDDVHPNDKETVAQRLALQALRRAYGFVKMDSDSPRARSFTVSNEVAVIGFAHAHSLYVYAPDNSRAPAFELAGTNGVWQPAKVLNYRLRKGNAWADEACIDAAEIRLSSDRVDHPVRVRYMGRPRSAGTVYNELSLPLGPFEASIPLHE